MTNRAYIRISTDMQTIEAQKFGILNYCNNIKLYRVQFTSEIVSGAKGWEKREIGVLISKIRKGDNIIVAELSRLGRSMLDLLTLLQEIKDRGGTVHAIKENLILGESGNTSGKLMVAMYALFGELEHDLISQRVKEGMACAKAKGTHFGVKRGYKRKLKLDKDWLMINELHNAQISSEGIGRMLKVSGQTVRLWIKRNIDKSGKMRDIQRFKNPTKIEESDIVQ